MSALGAVPGFGYPPLAYGESEFYSTSVKITLVNVAGVPSSILLHVSGSGAVFIRDIIVPLTTSAAVASRTGDIVVRDQDYNQLSRFRNPQQFAASSGGAWQWTGSVTNAYAIAGVGISPIQNVILLPGYFIVAEFFNTDVGDSYGPANLSGILIPTSSTQPAAPAIIAPPLLT